MAPASPGYKRPRTIAARMLDGRCLEAVRRKELIRMFEAAIDRVLTPQLRQRVATVAELTVIAESVRSRFMRGEATADDVVRTSRAAQHAERLLGLPKDDTRAAAGPSLREYLKQRQAASESRTQANGDGHDAEHPAEPDAVSEAARNFEGDR